MVDPFKVKIKYLQDQREIRLRQMEAVRKLMDSETDLDVFHEQANYFYDLRIEEKKICKMIDDLKAGKDQYSEDEGFSLH